jgi:hypothetical protein
MVTTDVGLMTPMTPYMQMPSPMTFSPGGAPADAEHFDEALEGCTKSAYRRYRRQKASFYRDVHANGSCPSSSTSRGECGLDGWAEHLVDQLNAGDIERAAAFCAMWGFVRCLTFNCTGTRAVQLALDLAGPSECQWIAAELHGKVRQAINSPDGNYVMQKLITVAPRTFAVFVLSEIAEDPINVAKHRYGCRIFNRILLPAGRRSDDGLWEKSRCALLPSDPEVVALVNKILATPAQVNDLSRHTFGHHVVQSILEYGNPSQQRLVAAALASDISHHSGCRNALYVVEHGLRRCCKRDQEVLARALLSIPKTQFVAMVADRYGSNVARALIDLGDEFCQEAMSLLSREQAAAVLRYR